MYRSFFIIKPDGMQRNLWAPIVTEILDADFSVSLSLLFSKRERWIATYEKFLFKRFFNDLIDEMSIGKVMVGVVDRNGNPVDDFRNLALSIREKYQLNYRHNTIHSSDNQENCEREIEIWLGHANLMYDPTLNIFKEQ